MKPLGRVSLYIPADNAAEFLPASIEALLSHTLPADEILVVDDGSRDGTADVVSRYREVKLVRHDRNRGLAAARNELVGSVDPHCAAHPEWLENLLPAFEDRQVAGAGGRIFAGFQDTLAEGWRAVHMRMDRGEERVRNPCSCTARTAGTGNRRLLA